MQPANGWSYLMPFNDRLKALRTAAGLTQEALARAADVSTATVARLEYAGLDPSWNTVVKLASALRVGPNDFLDKDNSAPVEESAKEKAKDKKKGK
jgi:transcriptional regulator with XRE-family HTH domain